MTAMKWFTLIAMQIVQELLPYSQTVRDGETTIKITFSLFEGGGGLGAERKIVQNAVFFVGNATTIKF